MAFLAFCRKLTQSLTISVGLFAAVCALTVFLVPVLWPSVRPDVWHRLARVPLGLVAGAVWCILCVAIARKAGWSGAGCVKFAMLTLFAASFVLVVASSQFFVFFSFCPAAAWFCGRLFSSDAGWCITAIPAPDLPTTLKLNS